MSHLENTLPKRLSLGFEVFKRIDKVYAVVFFVFLKIALLDKAKFIPLATLTFSNLAQTSVYMIFAILLLATIKASGSEAMVAAIFKGREKRMIVLAALVGGLAPFCSCEVIPFIAGLLALGTPLPPIMAFWLSSPLIDPPTLMITAGSLGWKFAISKAVFAVAIGISGGYAVKLLIASGLLGAPDRIPNLNTFETCCSQDSCGSGSCSDESRKSPVWVFWKEKSRLQIFFFEFKANGFFLLKWMLFAYTLESLMIQYVPAEAIGSVVGGEGIVPIVLSALVGVPAYLNSYIAPPVVSGLISQGMSVGSGMAFIVAGAISSIPAMTAVYGLVRKQIFAVYVLLGFSGAVASGVIYNLLA